MFSFFSMAFDYEDRKVARYESGEVLVDTAFCTDTGKYETAVSHPRYNDGHWVIVQEYDERDDAIIGHDLWVAIIAVDVDKLPAKLVDVSTSVVAIFSDILCEDNWRSKKENIFIEDWEQ